MILCNLTLWSEVNEWLFCYDTSNILKCIIASLMHLSVLLLTKICHVLYFIIRLFTKKQIKPSCQNRNEMAFFQHVSSILGQNQQGCIVQCICCCLLSNKLNQNTCNFLLIVIQGIYAHTCMQTHTSDTCQQQPCSSLFALWLSLTHCRHLM